MRLLLLSVITFIVFLAVALLINFCRRRLRGGRHGLSGMCHKNGDSCLTCASCADDKLKKR
ncbi:MAG TPA: hypothetical protein ENK33_05585 [Desulfobacterales bacterium]|nr:hypothetical protein [Desulfobacterales bacterium]